MRLTRGAALWQALRVAPAESAIAGLQVLVGASMTAKVIMTGSGPLPGELIGAAVMMTVVWACYFGAAPLCIYLGHTSARVPVAQRAPSGAPVAHA